MIYTVTKEGKVYDARGGDTGRVLFVGQVITVTSPKLVSIAERGDCYQISAPFSGYVQAARVKISGTVPPPPPPVQKARIVLTEADGRVRVFEEVV